MTSFASLVHVTLRISLDVHGDQQSFVASSRSFCRFFRLFVTQQWKVGNINMVLEGYSFVGLFVIVQKLFVTVRETLNIQSAFLNIKWVLFQIHHARSCNKLPWTVHHITWNIYLAECELRRIFGSRARTFAHFNFGRTHIARTCTFCPKSKRTRTFCNFHFFVWILFHFLFIWCCILTLENCKNQVQIDSGSSLGDGFELKWHSGIPPYPFLP